MLIINEVLIVDSALLNHLASLFAKLRRNNRLFGNIYVIVFGDLMRLPPVEGKGINFPSSVVCTIGAKVMFLTNSMLSKRGISNSFIYIITNLLPNNKVKAIFPIKDSI